MTLHGCNLNVILFISVLQIDHSIVESFGGGGKACITARVYPVLAVDKEAKLFAFNKGSHNIKILKLNAWSMKEAKILPIMKRRKPPV